MKFRSMTTRHSGCQYGLSDQEMLQYDLRINEGMAHPVFLGVNSRASEYDGAGLIEKTIFCAISISFHGHGT